MATLVICALVSTSRFLRPMASFRYEEAAEHRLPLDCATWSHNPPIQHTPDEMRGVIKRVLVVRYTIVDPSNQGTTALRSMHAQTD